MLFESAIPFQVSPSVADVVMWHELKTTQIYQRGPLEDHVPCLGFIRPSRQDLSGSLELECCL